MLSEPICLLIRCWISSRHGKLEWDCEWEGRRQKQSLAKKSL